MTKVLPKGFEDLVPFADRWALATRNQRLEGRWNATAEDLKAFYDAMLPRLEEILDLADKHPLGDMPEDVENLFYMALSIAEISPHIELYGGDPAVPHSFEESRFVSLEGDVRG